MYQGWFARLTLSVRDTNVGCIIETRVFKIKKPY